MVAPKTPTKPHLVIVGGGWGGFYCAEYIDYSKYTVTMISPRRTSAYTPLLASAAVGLFGFSLAEEPIRSKSRTQLRFYKASVLNIGFDKKECTCVPAFDDDPELEKTEFKVEYDYLVVSPGCIPNTFGTPGVDEHAIFVKNVSDAMRIRKTLFDLLEKACLPNVSPERAKQMLHIAVVGGGPTGIEITAELDDLCHGELSQVYPSVAKYINISVYDVAPNILGSFDNHLHQYATGQLHDRDVEVATSTHIERVDAEALYIKEQGRVPYGMLLWTTGNKNVPLIEKLEVRTPEKGLKRILTDPKLRVFKKEGDSVYDGVFAIGDAADVDGNSLPTTAEVAVQKAKYLVHEFNGAVNFQKPFEFRQKQMVSYIGQHDGVIAGNDAKDQGWTGSSAWLAWRQNTLSWNRSWRSRVAIVISWGMNWLFGKDIAKV